MTNIQKSQCVTDHQQVIGKRLRWWCCGLIGQVSSSGRWGRGCVCAGAAAQRDTWNAISFVLFKLRLQRWPQRLRRLLNSHPLGDLSETNAPINSPPSLSLSTLNRSARPGVEPLGVLREAETRPKSWHQPRGMSSLFKGPDQWLCQFSF